MENTRPTLSSLVKLELNTLTKTVLGSLFIALASQISIPLPFSPVPLTGQTLSIMFLGVSLGSKQAFLATILYLAECMIGLPCLAGGASSPAAFFGPTAGYLFAMPLLAYIAGFAKASRSAFSNSLILMSGSTLLLAMGSAVLGLFVGFDKALALGFYPFLAGDALKTLLLTTFIKSRKPAK